MPGDTLRAGGAFDRRLARLVCLIGRAMGVLLLAIVGILYGYIRRATTSAAPPDLTKSEREQLDRLLDADAPKAADKP